MSQDMIDTSATMQINTLMSTIDVPWENFEQEKHDTNITILASKVLIQRSQKKYKGKLISLIYEMLYIFLKESQN